MQTTDLLTFKPTSNFSSLYESYCDFSGLKNKHIDAQSNEK